MDWSLVDSAISEACAFQFKSKTQRPLGGGDINDAFLLSDARSAYFVKINQASRGDMFVAEMDGLRELSSTGTIRIPEPICYGEAGSKCFLVLEHIVFSSGNNASAEKLGRQLASLHKKTAKQFGWFRENTIGLTRQINSWNDDWLTFYRKNRIEFQTSLAQQNGCGSELVSLSEQLCENLPLFFASYQPKPSLLHGDLWSGNYAFDESAEPVIFDPAVYYGNREADLAMTELFGGFPSDFYQAYHEAWPLDDGYKVRKDLYNLYHVINHYNLFGGGYQRQAVAMLQRLLSEIR